MAARQMEDIQRKLAMLNYPRANAPAQSLLFTGMERYAFLEWLFFRSLHLSHNKVRKGTPWIVMKRLLASNVAPLFSFIMIRVLNKSRHMPNFTWLWVVHTFYMFDTFHTDPPIFFFRYLKLTILAGCEIGCIGRIVVLFYVKGKCWEFVFVLISY